MEEDVQMITKERWIELTRDFNPEQEIRNCRRLGLMHWEKVEQYINHKKKDWREKPEFRELSMEDYNKALSEIADQMVKYLDKIASTVPTDS
jgi:hypothetical protein